MNNRLKLGIEWAVCGMAFLVSSRRSQLNGLLRVEQGVGVYHKLFTIRKMAWRLEWNRANCRVAGVRGNQLRCLGSDRARGLAGGKGWACFSFCCLTGSGAIWLFRRACHGASKRGFWRVKWSDGRDWGVSLGHQLDGHSTDNPLQDLNRDAWPLTKNWQKS